MSHKVNKTCSVILVYLFSIHSHPTAASHLQALPLLNNKPLPQPPISLHKVKIILILFQNLYYNAYIFLCSQPSYSHQSSAGSASSQPQATPTTSNVSTHSQALFLQKVRESNEAVNSGDFRRAIKAYTEAITLDPTNPVLYTNRSTAFAKLNQFQKSLLDARKARELNPKWAKVGIPNIENVLVPWYCKKKDLQASDF